MICKSIQVSVHERLIRLFRERIQSEVWRSGQMLPGRRTLADEQGVALATVEKAVATLISEGLLRSDNRRGTFVAEVDSPKAKAFESVGSFRRGATVGILASVMRLSSEEARLRQWSAQILHACENALSADSSLTQCFVNFRDDLKFRTHQEIVALLRAERVDAVIVVEKFDDALARQLSTLGDIPMVLALYDPVETKLPMVYVDSVPGGMLAARHLRGRGYGSLVFLRPFTAPWVEARLAGAQAELGVEEIRVISAEPMPKVSEVSNAQAASGRDLAKRLLDDGFERGMGVIAPNDSVAGGFMEAAAERGFTAGTDYGIVGFDAYDRSERLSSLSPPLEQLGAEAARMMLAMLRGEASPFRVALPHRLIARNSSWNWKS